MRKTLLSLSLLACCTVNAAITMTLSNQIHDGHNGVMLEFSGSVNTHGSSKAPMPYFIHSSIDLSKAQFGSVPVSSLQEGHYLTMSGPHSLGSAASYNGTYVSGGIFGIAGLGLLLLDYNYLSGSFIEGKSFFADITLAEMGFAAGQSFEWTWGSGENADKVVLEVVAVPEPSTIALLSAGAAALLTVAVRRRRNKA